MNLLNIGSLNIDHVYRLPHLARPGETLSTREYARHAGGKGLNQSIAAARAGAAVRHAGCLGPEGGWLRDLLDGEGVDTTHLHEVDAPTGHAIIQVDDQGENSIVVFPGANGELTQAQVAAAVGGMAKGDLLLLQNETNVVPAAIRAGHDAGLTVLFNPAPMKPEVLDFPLDLIDILVCNETEGEELTGESEPEAILSALSSSQRERQVVLTLGRQGCLYTGRYERFAVPACEVQAVDTTGAGDTFVGYYAAGLAEGLPPRQALELAAAASALAVTRPGAAGAIPKRAEIQT